MQKSLGMEQLKAHLPPALGGTSLQPVAPAGASALAGSSAAMAAAVALTAAAIAPDASAAPAVPLKAEAAPPEVSEPPAPVVAPAPDAQADGGQENSGVKRAIDEAASDGRFADATAEVPAKAPKLEAADADAATAPQDGDAATEAKGDADEATVAAADSR